MEELLLDARAMPPPEPFEQASGILREMVPGQYLRMHHRRVPYPLFELCQAMSLNYRLIEKGRDSYIILVYFPADEPRLPQERLPQGRLPQGRLPQVAISRSS